MRPIRLNGMLSDIVVIAGFCLLTTSVHAAKTDVVVLVNGNAVTGEVKSLEFGTLSYSTDSMGTVSIDWEDIVAVTSNQDLQVELVDGRRFFGKLHPTEDRHAINLVSGDTVRTFVANDVVRITPIETDEKFFQRIDGSISFGFNTQKGSEVTTLNLAADARYRTLTYLLGIDLSSSITDQPSEETKARDRLGLNYQRFRANRWFTDWFSSWERNDELGINSRVSLGGGIGRYLKQTNKTWFSMTAGLQGTQESFVGAEDSTTNAEGRLQIRYQHRNLDPETMFTFTSNVYPLLEDLSQYRAETDLSFKREFIDDLNFEVLIYHSYLSDPTEGAATSDYGVTTSLGYSF